LHLKQEKVIRFFSTSHPVNILLLFLLGFVLRIPFFITPPTISENALTGIGFRVLNELFFSHLNNYPVLYPVLAYLIIFVQGLSLNGFINSQKLFPTPHLLFVLSYVIFTSLFPEWNTLSPQLMVSVIITICLQKLMLLYQRVHVANDLFMLAFIAGIGSLLYKPAIVLVVFLFAGILIFRPFHLSEWIIVFFGFSLPYYLGLSYLFIFDFWSFSGELIPYFKLVKPVFFRKSEEIVISILIMVPLISGFFYARKSSVRMVVLPRKSWVFITLILAISAFFVFAGGGYMFDALFLIMIPASFFITAFFYYPNVKFFPSLYLWLILGFLTVSHFL
jgi:hypothetical protein